MSKRLIILLLVLIVGSALIGLILYFLKSKVVRPAAPVVTSAPAVSREELKKVEPVSSSTSAPPVPLTVEEQNARLGREAVRRLAIVFTERFGSYSSQSRLANMSDLHPMMTEGMKTWSVRYVDDLLKSFSSDNYYGITTNVLSSTFKSYNDEAGLADIIMLTSREESKKAVSGDSEVFYQQLDLSLKRDNNVWKVDAAYWQKR